jgi:hypothetical protein
MATIAPTYCAKASEYANGAKGDCDSFNNEDWQEHRSGRINGIYYGYDQGYDEKQTRRTRQSRLGSHMCVTERNYTAMREGVSLNHTFTRCQIPNQTYTLPDKFA